MANTANASKTVNKSAKAGARFYPNLKDQVPYHAEVEFKQLRAMAYDLIDAKLDIIDKTLTANTLIDRDLVAGRLLEVIARQDIVGGWTVQFATNKDGSTKFKDTSFVTQNTTASSYTAYLFLATSETEAILIAHEPSGGGGSSTPSTGSSFNSNTDTMHEIVAIPGDTTGGFSTRTLGFAGLDPSKSGSSFGNGDRVEGPFSRAATGGLINQECGWNLGIAQLLQTRWGGEVVLKLYVQFSGNNFRVAAGLSAWGVGTVPSILDATTNAANQAYFSFDTGVDGTTFWRTVTSNAGAATRTATTVAIATDTVYVMRIRFTATQIDFFIDDVLTNSHTTNLPTSTTTIGIAFGIKNLAAIGSNANLSSWNMWY